MLRRTRCVSSPGSIALVLAGAGAQDGGRGRPGRRSCAAAWAGSNQRARASGERSFGGGGSCGLRRMTSRVTRTTIPRARDAMGQGGDGGAFVRVHAGRGQATFCAGAHRTWSGSLHQRAGCAKAEPEPSSRTGRRCGEQRRTSKGETKLVLLRSKRPLKTPCTKGFRPTTKPPSVTNSVSSQALRGGVLTYYRIRHYATLRQCTTIGKRSMRYKKTLFFEAFGLPFDESMTVSLEVLPCARFEIAPISKKADITIRAQTNIHDPHWVDLFYCGVWRPSDAIIRAHGIRILQSPPDLKSQNYSL